MNMKKEKVTKHVIDDARNNQGLMLMTFREEAGKWDKRAKDCAGNLREWAKDFDCDELVLTHVTLTLIRSSRRSLSVEKLLKLGVSPRDIEEATEYTDTTSLKVKANG